MDTTKVPLDSFEFERDLATLLNDDCISTCRPCHHKQHSLVKRIEIFDFDNTLFCSPLPNPALWHRSLIGRLMSPEVGWFRDVRTLSEPFVVCRKSTTTDSNTCRWFSTRIVSTV